MLRILTRQSDRADEPGKHNGRLGLKPKGNGAPRGLDEPEPQDAVEAVHEAGPDNLLTRTKPNEEKERKQAPLSLSLIRRLLTFTRPYALRRNVLIGIVMLRAIQLPVLAWMVGWIIRGPIEDNNLWGAPFSEEGIGMAWAIGIYSAVMLVTQFTLHFRLKLAMQLGEQVIHDLRNLMFRHLQRMPMSFFDQTKVGRLIARFASDAENVRVGIQEVLFVSIVNGGQMLVAWLLMAWVDAALALLVLGVGVVLWVINRLLRARFAKAHREVQESMSRVTATLAESVSGIRVTQGFVRQDVNAAMFADLIDDHSHYNMAVTRANGLFNPLLQANTQFFFAMLLLVGGYFALRETAPSEPGDLISFFFLATTFFGPVAMLGQQYMQALTAMASSERVFRLLDAQPAWSDPPDAIELPPIEGRVTFDNVHFEYVPNRPVLQDISFTAEPGQIIALVGHTGSGKSSIINLISKFHLPTSGKLLIDDYDITQVSSKSLHDQMGIVLQSNFLFSGSVMDNIRVGKPAATNEEVRDAALKLDCLDLLEALPEGLETDVGEGGGNLSLGQRQLVCFTRAMLADPRILILDEATSSVDTMTEARIQKSLEVLFEGRTTFVVAHRLSTIRHADMVLVLDHGRIVERGSHTDLLTTGGVYANLYRNFINASEA